MKSTSISTAPRAVPAPDLPSRTRRRPRPAKRHFWRDPAFYLLLLVLFLLGSIGYYFASTLRPVSIRINDQVMSVLTHQTTVRGVLTETGFKLNDGDVALPDLDEPVPSDGRIVIREARPVVIQADGETLQRRTQSTTVDAVLREASVFVKPYDKVLLDGRQVELASPLPRFSTVLAPASRPAIPANTSSIPHLSVQRAIPINVEEDGARSVIFTTESTLGQALSGAGILVYLGDEVNPDLDQPVSAGRTIFIRRSQPASITVDNRTIRTRTQVKTVAELLAQEGVQLVGQDFTNVPLTDPIRANLAVNITRIREVFETQSESIPFQTQILPNAELEIDKTMTAQVGVAGVKKRTIKTIYENGKQISRGIEREWIDRAPQNLIYNYGTKIVDHPLTLPSGETAKYWRIVRVFATSYTAATSGKTTDHPQYGVTYTGLKAGKGVVAVDPTLIRLGSNVYVPGYGVAVAGDTGGRILGRRIDLGYPEDSLVFWFDWVDVYLLSPAPPRSQINFQLPEMPKNRDWLP